MGFIALKGVEAFGKIGVSAEERLVGRKFLIDIEVKCSLKEAGKTDRIENAFNYEILADAIHHNLKSEYKLMEAACRAIAFEILNKAPDIEAMRIRIHKLSPMMKGAIEASVIEWDYPGDW